MIVNQGTIALVTMIYTLILINYRKFPFKIIVFASGVHLNIFIESHYMDQTAIIFLTSTQTIKQMQDWRLLFGNLGQEKEFQ